MKATRVLSGFAGRNRDDSQLHQGRHRSELHQMRPRDRDRDHRQLALGARLLAVVAPSPRPRRSTGAQRSFPPTATDQRTASRQIGRNDRHDVAGTRSRRRGSMGRRASRRRLHRRTPAFGPLRRDPGSCRRGDLRIRPDRLRQAPQRGAAALPTWRIGAVAVDPPWAPHPSAGLGDRQRSKSGSREVP